MLSASAFKQQKLPAWQPILTAGTVLPTFFLIGIAFIPIGFGLLLSSNQVKEKVIEYTHCVSSDPEHNGKMCSEVIGANYNAECKCSLNFTLTENFDRDVYIYYGLTNFYQNHRRYVRSRDDKQLLGNLGSRVDEACVPYATIDVENGQKTIVPCGAIANSIFNDTFALSYKDLNRMRKDFSPIKLTKTGIAWATDKSSKFRNPPKMDSFKEFARPPNWAKPIDDLDKDPSNNGLQNEALMVWMRTAALPSFRKLYARVNHTVSEDYKIALPKGEYRVDIEYRYPGKSLPHALNESSIVICFSLFLFLLSPSSVTPFKGTKSLIISNTSWLGGKNSFLGVAYVGVGFICLILSGVFLFIHRKFGKPTSDLLSINQRTPYLAS